MVMRALLSLMLIACASLASADYRHRVVLEPFFSEDTDGAEFRNILAGYDRLYGRRQFMGFRVGQRRYHEDIATEDKIFDELKLLGQVSPSDKLDLMGSLSFLQGDDWNPLVFNATLVYKPNDRVRIEPYIGKDLIDAIRAINDENAVLTTGVAVDYRFSEKVTVVGNLYGQSFDDGNQKNSWKLLMLYTPESWGNFSAKLEARQSHADFNPPEYFAPDTHEQYFALMRYIRTLGKKQAWWFKFEGGPGVQYIDGVSEDAYKFRFDLGGPITDALNLDTFAGCTSDGGDEDYRYCFAGLALQRYW